MKDSNNTSTASRLWVIAFDKGTGERTGFTVCPSRNAAFYKALYEIKGFRAEVFTSEQVDEMIAEEQTARPRASPSTPTKSSPGSPRWASSTTPHSRCQMPPSTTSIQRS